MIQHLHAIQTALDHVRILADPTPAPGAGVVNTTGILSFLATKILPILLGGLGVIFVTRANRGEVGKVMTSSTISIIGLAFVAGATVLFTVGDSIIKLVTGG